MANQGAFITSLPTLIHICRPATMNKEQYITGGKKSALTEFGEIHANDCMNPSEGRSERRRTICSCSCVLHIIREQVTDFPAWLLTGIVHQLMPGFCSGLQPDIKRGTVLIRLTSYLAFPDYILPTPKRSDLEKLKFVTLQKNHMKIFKSV